MWKKLCFFPAKSFFKCLFYAWLQNDFLLTFRLSRVLQWIKFFSLFVEIWFWNNTQKCFKIACTWHYFVLIFFPTCCSTVNGRSFLFCRDFISQLDIFMWIIYKISLLQAAPSDSYVVRFYSRFTRFSINLILCIQIAILWLFYRATYISMCC